MLICAAFSWADCSGMVDVKPTGDGTTISTHRTVNPAVMPHMTAVCAYDLMLLQWFHCDRGNPYLLFDVSVAENEGLGAGSPRLPHHL